MPGQVSQKEIISDLRKKIDAIMARRPGYGGRTENRAPVQARALRESIAGEEVSNALGACYFIRTTFPSHSYHGSFRIDSLTGPDMDSAAILAGEPRIASLAIDNALFLDTETTGLAGGTGTFAFLIGLGWFEGNDFIVCQLFARDYHEEAAMLAMLREIVSEKRFLVTFNGRGFDLSLLAARFILSRQRNPFPDMPHLDLLFPARRLIGHRLENSRLVTLEKEVLGVMRTDDVPGFEIPARYFNWLRTRDASLLTEVFHHNRLDIVSMAALVHHLTGLLKGGDYHHADLLAAAKMYLAQGSSPQAETMLCSLMDSHERTVSRDAGIMLSLHYKRIGRWRDAVAVWETMAAVDPHDLFAAEELAKWLEHRQSDFGRAAVLVERIIEGAQGITPTDREGLVYRLARLKRKMEARRTR